jgi:hypothetical protein
MKTTGDHTAAHQMKPGDNEHLYAGLQRHDIATGRSKD